MKKIIFILMFFIAFLVFRSSAQNTETKIKDIRTKFQTIENNKKTYKKETFDTGCGTVVYYFDGTNLREVALEKYEGDDATECSYYYWDSKLIFSFWEIPQGGTEQNNVPNLEYRFYFSDNIPIRYMKNKDIIDINKADHNPKDVTAEGNKLIDLYKTKQFSELCN
jgi:hypothetical protein